MTLTFKLDPDSVETNQQAEHIIKLFISPVIVRAHTHTHVPGRILYLDH